MLTDKYVIVCKYEILSMVNLLVFIDISNIKINLQKIFIALSV